MNKIKRVPKLACNNCGQCCNNVALHYSPAQLKRYYLDWRFQRKLKSGDKRSNWIDIYLIYPMLTALGYDKIAKVHRYKCKNLKDKNGKYYCSIYSIRPGMCIDFGKWNIDTQTPMKMNKEFYPDCSLIEGNQ